MMDDRIRNRLIKVLELAQRGVGGERINAQKILNEQLAKWNMTIEDLGLEPETELAVYVVKGRLEKMLICQIAVYVCNSEKVMHDLTRRGRVKIKATVIQHIEIEAMFRYYRKLLKKEVQKLYVAFINKHDIFCDEGRNRSKNGAGHDGTKGIDSTKIGNMMESLSRSKYTPPRRTLTGT